MLTDPKLRSQVDALWDKFWTGGLSNPLDAIEQFSYLLFLKRLDDRENAAERQAKRRGETDRGAAPLRPYLQKEMRWGYWTKLKAEESLSHLKKVVFPNLVNLADEKSSFGEYMRTAECKTFGKASLLIEENPPLSYRTSPPNTTMKIWGAKESIATSDLGESVPFRGRYL